MAVSDLDVSQTFTCNVTTTVFAIPFAWQQEDVNIYEQVRVRLRNTVTGAITTLTLDTHYTVSSSTNQVTTLTAYSSTYQLIIDRLTPLTQIFDFINNGANFATRFETALDRLLMMIQEANYTITNSLLQNVTGTRGSPTLLTAATAITYNSLYGYNKQFVQGNGGAVVLTATPTIPPAVTLGQRCVIQGRSNTSTVTLQPDVTAGGTLATGLIMNGPCQLEADSRIEFEWDGTYWIECERNL